MLVDILALFGTLINIFIKTQYLQNKLIQHVANERKKGK